MINDAQLSSGVSRFFYRSLVMDMPQLFKAILKFNTSVIFETKKDGFLNDNGAALPDGIFNSSSRAKAKFIGSYSIGFWDFEEESRRIALLDVSTLNELVLSIGSALCSPLLNKFILKKEVETLNRDIESKYLDFARGAGRFILGDIGEIIKIEEQTTTPEKMRDLVIKYGMYAHGICSAAWPESLQDFENQKIKRSLPDLFEHRVQLNQVNPSHLRAIWFNVKKILLKEVAPQWIPCFS